MPGGVKNRDLEERGMEREHMREDGIEVMRKLGAEGSMNGLGETDH